MKGRLPLNTDRKRNHRALATVAAGIAGPVTKGFSAPWPNQQCNEFANTSFAEATTTKKQKKDPVMKMKNKVLSRFIVVTQSKWMRPALMTLAIIATMLIVTGCPSHPH